MSKKWKPSFRCSSRKTRSAVNDGSAKISEKETARMAKTKSGMRLNDMPGERSLKMVTMKFSAPAVVEMLLKIKPSA